jgi:hypothetical protein
VIDYYEANNVELDVHAAVLRDRGYHYGTHWLPHDAEAKLLGMKRTRIEQLRDLLPGHTFRRVADHTRIDGINAVRKMLRRTWFDRDKCSFAIEALRQYRSEWDAKAKVLRPEPKHDWTSHCADSFRYLAMSVGLEVDEHHGPPKPLIIHQPTSVHVHSVSAGSAALGISVEDIVRMKERARAMQG